jgi:transcriptional regulator of acetoin/glycerol metabolism
MACASSPRQVAGRLLDRTAHRPVVAPARQRQRLDGKAGVGAPAFDSSSPAHAFTVEQAHGNISEASKRLGISRNTICRKLRWNLAR